MKTSDPKPGAGDDAPVTVVVTRRVKPGREADYEAWLAGLQAEARQLPGYLGVTTQRPGPGGPREYVSAIRFATLADLRAFETGELRARPWRTSLTWSRPTRCGNG